ncbi:MAG TPA: alpha/beta family hydrolase [Candidatus Deferrimicrobiaceae bacterium]|jgi:dienelactone hydrolase
MDILAEPSPNLIRHLEIPAGDVSLPGEFALPRGAHGIVLFAHGSGSSRLSPRNAFVARVLREAGFGTLLFDLLTEDEDIDSANRFEIDLITDRLSRATRSLAKMPEARHHALGYFGASTGAAAAIKAAAIPGGEKIGAVVSRGGRPDLAEASLGRVTAPTLLIVGERDEFVLRLNRDAYRKMTCTKRIEIVPGATHLFEEAGALEGVAKLAADWFRRHLADTLAA